VGADPVRDFYTAHPYPPPVANLDRARDEWRNAGRDRAEYHLLWPARPYRVDLDILVAGCGTWQAAKHALCRPRARVVGVDVSPTSIGCTDTLKRKYGLSNLELRQLPIERVDDLKRRFDVIVCTGVLHHLADPDAGIRALRSVLRPDGAMYLMVYAPYGRTGVYMLQDYCRRLGVGTSVHEVNDLASVLRSLPQQHPLAGLLKTSRDVDNPDALADALLNPRDRSYSVPQLFDMLDRNGLTFSRWYWQAPYLPQCGAISMTPHARRLASLPERDQHSAMELWRGTITSHSLVVHRGDASPEEGDRRFDVERAAGYVPIRLALTLCVQERLPPGAAAVLLNRTHKYHDLILPIDAYEKRLFDAIDGRRSISEIADVVSGSAEGGRALDFFERLWRYDQVVFDRSRAASRTEART
jgi:SAM-dependent methyltransferase